MSNLSIHSGSPCSISSSLAIPIPHVTDQGPTLMLDCFKTKGVAPNCQPQEERDLSSLQQTIIREGLEAILDTAMPSLGRVISHSDATGSADLQKVKPNEPVQTMPPIQCVAGLLKRRPILTAYNQHTMQCISSPSRWQHPSASAYSHIAAVSHFHMGSAQY